MPIGHTILTAIQSGAFIFIGLMGIGFLIGFHELGHFIFCKLFKIRTPSFSIGMGPRILTKKIGETEFSLSAIPLGGYVEIAGSAEVGQGDQADAHADDEHSFSAKPYYQKLLVMLGGILFNLSFAYAALSLLFMIGMPKLGLIYPALASREVSNVAKESPASSLLKNHDVITSVNGIEHRSGKTILDAVKASPLKTITLDFLRDGKPLKGTVTLGTKEIKTGKNKTEEIGFLGVELSIPRYGFIGALKQGFKTTNTIIAEVTKAFKGMFTRNGFNQLGGPIAVISDTIKGASRGFKIFLFLLAFISINLAVLNLIPLPIFDGGQLLFYTIEAIIRRPLPNKIREWIHIVTWVGVLALALYLSFKDVMRMIPWGN